MVGRRDRRRSGRVLASTGVARRRRRGDRADRPDARRSSCSTPPTTVLRPAILWNDQRTAARVRRDPRRRSGRERLIEITGNDALTGFTAPKLVWVRDHEPDIWARVAHVLLPKDYVRLRLTGDHAIDKADGAGTILFDLAARDWSPEVLAALGIDPAWLPPTFEGPVVTGTVGADGGGRDRAARRDAGRGRRRRPGRERGRDGAVDAGRRGPVARHVRGDVRRDDAAARSSRPAGSTRSATRCPGRWHMMSVMLSAAGSLRWFRDALAPGVDVRGARRRGGRRSPAGSDGLLFLPYLTGERSPHPDPLARGAFVGLTVGHERRHLTRAVMEGVAFGLRDGLDLMVDAGVPAPSQIRASGGGIASPVWRQILADVLGAEIATVRTTEGAAYGAAMLAAVGAGWFADVDAIAGAWVEATPVASPGPDAARLRGAARRVPEALSGARPDVPRPQRLTAIAPASRGASLSRGARAPRARPR